MILVMNMSVLRRRYAMRTIRRRLSWVMEPAAKLNQPLRGKESPTPRLALAAYIRFRFAASDGVSCEHQAGRVPFTPPR